jgi:hypothetical protein
MEDRSIFTDEEWRTLTFAPLWVFCSVAEADADIDEREIAALSMEVEDAYLYDEPLVQEVFEVLQEDDQPLLDFKADEREGDDGLAEVADLLDRKVPGEQAEAFKKAMLFIARSVAEASGEESFSAERVSGGEELSLFRIADLLGVSL